MSDNVLEFKKSDSYEIKEMFKKENPHHIDLCDVFSALDKDRSISDFLLFFIDENKKKYVAKIDPINFNDIFRASLLHFNEETKKELREMLMETT